MARSKGSLDNRVAQQLGRGKNQQQVINAIRNSKGGKFINVRYIKQAITRYRAAQQSATKLAGLTPSQQIGKALTPTSGKGSSTVSVAFHFLFDFSAADSSKKAGRTAVHMVVDLPATTAKSGLAAELQQMAQDWIEEHYGSDPEGRSSIRVIIDSVKGV